MRSLTKFPFHEIMILKVNGAMNNAFKNVAWRAIILTINIAMIVMINVLMDFVNKINATNCIV